MDNEFNFIDDNNMGRFKEWWNWFVSSRSSGNQRIKSSEFEKQLRYLEDLFSYDCSYQEFLQYSQSYNNLIKLYNQHLHVEDRAHFYYRIRRLGDRLSQLQNISSTTVPIEDSLKNLNIHDNNEMGRTRRNGGRSSKTNTTTPRIYEKQHSQYDNKPASYSSNISDIRKTNHELLPNKNHDFTSNTKVTCRSQNASKTSKREYYNNVPNERYNLRERNSEGKVSQTTEENRIYEEKQNKAEATRTKVTNNKAYDDRNNQYPNNYYGNASEQNYNRNKSGMNEFTNYVKPETGAVNREMQYDTLEHKHYNMNYNYHSPYNSVSTQMSYNQYNEPTTSIQDYQHVEDRNYKDERNRNRDKNRNQDIDKEIMNNTYKTYNERINQTTSYASNAYNEGKVGGVEKEMQYPNLEDKRHNLSHKHESLHNNQCYEDEDWDEDRNVEPINEQIEETKTEIVDIHHYFVDDTIKNHPNKYSLEYFQLIKDKAQSFNDGIEQFNGDDYMEYFILHENLMQLIEIMDRIRCEKDEILFPHKIEIINFIKELIDKLNSRKNFD